MQILEQLLVEPLFTANDVHSAAALVGGAHRPQRQREGCYMRQIGLIQLMAQIGSWVPSSATIGIADRIFTSVCAVDHPATGQSTFMRKMAETFDILK